MSQHQSERRTSIWLGFLVLLLPLGLSAQSAALHPDTNGTDTDTDTAQVVVMSGSVINATHAMSHAGLGEDSRVDGDSEGVSPRRQSLENQDDHLEKGSPCEAGHPCRADEWCSPSRSVCRPCKDVQLWCNDTDLIQDKYPTCERYCFEIVLNAVREFYEAQLKTARQQLFDKDLAIVNLTKTMERQKETCRRVTVQLEKECKIQEGNTTTIAGLACALTVSLLWALAVTVFVCRPLFRQKIGSQDPEAMEVVPRSTEQVNAPLLPTQEVKAPVQDHTMDSGEYAGNSGHPGARVPGDAAVVPC